MSGFGKIIFKLVFLVGLVWSFVFCLHGTAVAYINHSHVKISSPFDGTANRSHCLLNQHFSVFKVCPHMSQPTAGETILIASECGGNATGTIPEKFSFNKNPSVADFSLSLGPDIISSAFFSSLQVDLPKFSNLIAPPPKLL